MLSSLAQAQGRSAQGSICAAICITTTSCSIRMQATLIGFPCAGRRPYNKHILILVGLVRGVLFLICDVSRDILRKLAEDPGLDLWREVARRWQCLLHFLQALPHLDLTRDGLGGLWGLLPLWNRAPVPSVLRLAKLAFRSEVRFHGREPATCSPSALPCLA